MADPTVPATKPGIRTTEFWAFVLVSVCTTALALAGKIPGDIAVGVIGTGGAVYTGSRVVVKR